MIAILDPLASQPWMAGEAMPPSGSAVLALAVKPRYLSGSFSGKGDAACAASPHSTDPA